MKSTRRYALAIAALPLWCAACGAAAPSKELLSARDAYANVKTSGAVEANPAGARGAQEALSEAEELHQSGAGSVEEASAAYVATRKSELAVAQAEELRSRQDREKAEQAYREQVERQLGKTRDELSSTQKRLTSTQQQLDTLVADSEKAKNERVGWRKKGENLVITLSGVSFDTAGHTLTVEAKKRLDVVAHALKDYPERPITIAGYTDDKGPENANLELSQKRAESVKAYLISQGVPTTRLFSEGRGESNPTAPNTTAEGRASNRRVEITLHPPGEATERQLVKGTDPAPASKTR